MSRTVALLLAALLCATSAVADGPRRFALVVGENRSNKADIPALHFADDDAVATHRLLVQAGVEALLLVDLDADSRRLHRGVVAFGKPTRETLSAAFAELLERVAAASAQGHETELLFFYSGHGDVEHGEGYVVLEDGRLTRSALYRELLERSPADRNHVVVDACKSYFLAFEKGAGGQRAPFPAGFASATSDARARTGFVLSTSSDRDSHEWERFQAGIFSHQVRSALRGAADADADGQVTYPELGAFLQVANQDIENPRFRPDFVVRPPGGEPTSTGLISWSRPTETLVLDPRAWGHLYLENGVGERILDVNPRPGESVVLHLPADRPLFVRRHDLAEEWAIPAAGSTELAALSPSPPGVSRRGAEHLAFERLFAAPFGKSDVVAYQEHLTATPDPIAATTVARIDDTGPGWRAITGWSALGVGAIAVTLGVGANLYALERFQSGQELPQAQRAERNALISTLNGVAMGSYIAAVVAGGVGGGLLVWTVVDDE